MEIKAQVHSKVAVQLLIHKERLLENLRNMDPEIQREIKNRLEKLPKVVRDAITSADTSANLRKLSETHKLHLDQWEILETQVMLTLLAFQELEDLPINIEKNVGVSHEIAEELAIDISRIIFEPIREELERELDHPDAQVQTQTEVEQVTTQALASEAMPVTSTAPPPAPIASIPMPPETKAIRAPISEVYKPGEASSVRKDVVNDPYREPPK